MHAIHGQKDMQKRLRGLRKRERRGGGGGTRIRTHARAHTHTLTDSLSHAGPVSWERRRQRSRCPQSGGDLVSNGSAVMLSRWCAHTHTHTSHGHARAHTHAVHTHPSTYPSTPAHTAAACTAAETPRVKSGQASPCPHSCINKTPPDQEKAKVLKHDEGGREGGREGESLFKREAGAS